MEYINLNIVKELYNNFYYKENYIVLANNGIINVKLPKSLKYPKNMPKLIKYMKVNNLTPLSTEEASRHIIEYRNKSITYINGIGTSYLHVFCDISREKIPQYCFDKIMYYKVGKLDLSEEAFKAHKLDINDKDNRKIIVSDNIKCNKCYTKIIEPYYYLLNPLLFNRKLIDNKIIDNTEYKIICNNLNKNNNINKKLKEKLQKYINIQYNERFREFVNKSKLFNKKYGKFYGEFVSENIPNNRKYKKSIANIGYDMDDNDTIRNNSSSSDIKVNSVFNNINTNYGNSDKKSKLKKINELNNNKLNKNSKIDNKINEIYNIFLDNIYQFSYPIIKYESKKPIYNYKNNTVFNTLNNKIENHINFKPIVKSISPTRMNLCKKHFNSCVNKFLYVKRDILIPADVSGYGSILDWIPIFKSGIEYFYINCNTNSKYYEYISKHLIDKDGYSHLIIMCHIKNMRDIKIKKNIKCGILHMHQEIYRKYGKY